MHQLTHIGLDVHKDTIAVAVLRPDTIECDERVIPNTSEAVRRLLSRYPAGDRSDSGHSRRRDRGYLTGVRHPTSAE